MMWGKQWPACPGVSDGWGLMRYDPAGHDER